KDIVTTILIPTLVQTELDRFKSEASERGKHARDATTNIDAIINEKKGSLNEGVNVSDNYIIKSSYNIEKELGKRFKGILDDKNDVLLLDMLKTLCDQGKDAELVTLDTSLRLMGSALGLPVYDWKDFEVTEIYKGWREVEVEHTVTSGMYSLKQYEVLPLDNITPLVEDFPMPNEYFILKSGDQKILTRYNSEKQGLMRIDLERFNRNIIKPQNDKQRFLADALANPEIKIIFAIGLAGSGKTYMAVNSAFEQVILPLMEQKHKPEDEYDDEEIERWGIEIKGRKKVYNKALITRTLVGIEDEEEIGALPGELDEKLRPWMLPIQDQIEKLGLLYGLRMREAFEYFKRENIMEILPVQFVRGRSLQDCLWIIDDAQNLTRRKILTLGTRPSGKSKVIFAGDPLQCDLSSIVLSSSNPLVYASNLFKDSEISATIYFGDKNECIRSDIAREFMHRMG
ncbi:PhoH family protein, partial [Candidatus Woesearchaeota archaeon]|nr:PhoH family protein [Candidatus Woesearchaeota archaeon]